MQGDFQAVLLTDGSASFVVFLYKQFEIIDEIDHYQVGFNSGEDDSYINIVGRDPADYTGNLQEITAFRIDGNTHNLQCSTTGQYLPSIFRFLYHISAA